MSLPKSTKEQKRKTYEVESDISEDEAFEQYMSAVMRLPNATAKSKTKVKPVNPIINKSRTPPPDATDRKEDESSIKKSTCEAVTAENDIALG